MEKPPIQKNEENPAEMEHREAVDFVEKNRDLLEHYARGKVNFEPAPKGLDTFAFDLEENTIYINSRFYKSRGLSDEKTMFATLHEIEHMMEKGGMLREERGEKKFSEYLKKIKKSQAFSLLDNCVADNRENRAVVSRTSQSFGELEKSLYKEDLFKQTDFTSEPRHIQFAQAILREGRVPEEVCSVAPEVREKIDKLQAIKSPDGASLIDVMTHPDTPMSLRLKLQDKFVWPLCRELLDKDMEDEENKRKEKKEQEDKEGGGENGESGEKSENERKGETQTGGKPPEKTQSGKSGEEQKLDPNEVFKEAYERAAEKVPNAVPLEEIEKAFKKWQEAARENPLDKADAEYAEKLGVTKEDLRRYREIVKSLEKTVDPETGESLIEELRNGVFAKIISRRLKSAPLPRYPVEEGEDLVHPADLVAEVKAGNLEPKVWETFEIREKTGAKFGEVEITLVGDRSGSMEDGSGRKMIEQRKAVVLVMEALKSFAEMCEEERVNMDKPLEVRSEVYSFQSTAQDKTPIKKMSRELEEKERIEVSSVLSSAPGNNTTDYVTLEAINTGIGEETEKKIREGELTKIIIVFTDGVSDNVGKVKEELLKLRGRGVIAIGVGITEAGVAALETYAPDARLAETAEELCFVLKDLLKEYLADI